MAKSVAGASVELTGEVTKMAIEGGGRFARRVGENVVQRLQPNSIPPEVLELLPPDALEVLRRQALLKQYEGRVAMVGDLIDPDDGLEDEAGLKARASSRAQTLVEVGVARPDTAVELRPVVPRDATNDPALSDRLEKTVWFTRHALARDHDITSVALFDPITPSEHRDSPPDLTATYGAISTDLSLLSEQLDVDDGSRRRHPAILTFMGAPYSNAIVEDRAGESRLLEHYGLLVLKRVGTFPEDNLLVPAGRTGISEGPGNPSPIWVP